MEHETLKYLEERLKPAIVPGERAGTMYLRHGFEPVKVPAAPFNLKAFDIKSLVAALRAPLETRTDISWWRRILIGEKAVVGIAQGELVDETVKVTLELPTHPAFAKLNALQHTQGFTQRDLIRLLRATFADFVPAETVSLYRNLKVSTDGKNDYIQDNALSSLSATVRAKLESGGGKLPDSFVVTTPVFAVPELLDIRAAVTVLVESEPGGAAPTFELTTVYNTLEEAQNHASQVLMRRINDALFDDKAMVGTAVLRASI